MASIRSLKNDVNFLTSELVTQAYLSKVLFKTMDDESLGQFVVKALEFRQNFIAKVNHPDGKENPKLVKAYFSKIRKDLISQFEEMVVSLNETK